jgi:thiol-disulfide isomerase/thioredoxin
MALWGGGSSGRKISFPTENTMKPTIQLAALLLALSPITILPAFAEDVPATEKEAEVKPLKMGDPAPAFKVTEWYKGEAVTLDDKGTFIVECWATWCGPCIAAFPHLSEIAKANEGKVTVIGVNVWERKEPKEVKEFVEAQGDKMSYLVAADGEEVIANDWLKAAGKNGIPCAFVVSKGIVSWIGHPAALDQKLIDSIVDGTYDIAAAVKAEEKSQAAAKYFQDNVVPALTEKDYATAITKLEEMKKEFPDDVAIIDGHIERLKKMAPAEEE